MRLCRLLSWLDSESLWSHLSATLAKPTSVRDFLQGIQPQQTKPGSVQRENRGTESGELLIGAPGGHQPRRLPCFLLHSPDKSVKLMCQAEMAWWMTSPLTWAGFLSLPTMLSLSEAPPTVYLLSYLLSNWGFGSIRMFSFLKENEIFVGESFSKFDLHVA